MAAECRPASSAPQSRGPPGNSPGACARQSRDQRHEAHRAQHLALELAALAPHADQLLIAMLGTDWRNEYPAFHQALQQHARYLLAGGGDDDALEWRLLRPTLGAVAEARRDVVQAERRKALLRHLQQIEMPLHAEDATAEPCQHSGLVAGPRA